MVLFRFDKKFNIEENKETYISPYSTFMLKNYPFNLEQSHSVCDYGSGTGILGITASHFCKKVVFVEKDNEAFELSKKNIEHNVDNTCEYFLYHTGSECTEQFDTIICNPASLPEVADVNAFCNGGKLGMDMILEVLDFSERFLSNNGRLFIIITSILPRSIAENFLLKRGMNYRVYSTMVLPFRLHYKKIKDWVDNTKKDYSEMYYIKKGDFLYEELLLWEVYKE